MMKKSFEQERPLKYSFLNAPLIAAGTLSDAVCCEGPKRDFAAEKHFRLQNAMKMYPAGYTLGPHAFDYSKQYVHSAPQYAVPVARAPLPEAQPYVHQRHVVVKPIQYTYASLPPAQPPARIYRYDNQQVPGLPPMSPATTDRPFSEAAAKWTWDNSGGSRGYAAPPPFESMGSFPEVGLRTLSTLPENTPRDGYFSASLPKIVEVVRVEGEAGPVKPSDKYVPKPAGDEDFAQSEPEDEGDNRKPEMERTTTTAQVDTQAEDSENRESSETPREEEQDDSRNKMSPANNNEDEVQEGEQAEDTASSEASSELMSGEEPPFTEETQLGEKKEDVQRNEEEGEGNKGFEGEGKKGEEKLFSKQMEDESQISGAAANNNYGKNFKVKFDSQATDENLKHFPMFSMTTASTFSGIDFMTTPRLGKMEGELLQASDGGLKVEVSGPTATNNWPVGYVPPPDQKYKKLVLGNQVYYEGGTFYLTETGAYLLGLRG